MARVHCPDCEMAVVLDPNGICPEGHVVGNVGQRIELAIGDDKPHPDEPEPWSVMIEPPAQVEEAPAEPRDIRPISVASEDAPGDDEADNDELMLELHALTDLDARTEERAATGPAVAPAPSAHGTEHAGSGPSDDEPEVYHAPVAEAAGSSSSDDEPEVYHAPVAEAAGSAPASKPTPAKRSSEDLEAIAELAALFDAPPSKPAPRDEAPTQDRAAEQGEADADGPLATVSHLPYPATEEPAGGSGSPATPERDARASGEALDWSHFTARGKRRRFGR